MDKLDSLLAKACAVILTVGASLGMSWKSSVDSQLYTIQREYVTQAQLAETLRQLEKTIQTTIVSMDSTRRAEGKAFNAWLTRIESQQLQLSRDIKEIIKER